ncbi:MAG: type III polyketide synthase, partial [Vicinamibacteria bacterium]
MSLRSPMATVLSVERFVPPYRYDQETVTRWVREWLAESDDPNALRLLPVYAAAGVASRASVLPIEEVFFPGDFETQNDRYGEKSREAAVALARGALSAAGLAARDIDLIVSVSCTGFMIPALDAYVADALGMGPRLVRLPITESGCAGGVVGLARAADHLAAHPERAALLLAVELSSLTFQRWDRSATNVVSSAIFG